MFSNDFSMRPRSNRTWSTPWSTPPSSRSTAMDKAQKGDSEPGHTVRGSPHAQADMWLATRDTSATALPNLKSTLLSISRKRGIGQGGSLLQYIGIAPRNIYMILCNCRLNVTCRHKKGLIYTNFYSFLIQLLL